MTHTAAVDAAAPEFDPPQPVSPDAPQVSAPAVIPGASDAAGVSAPPASPRRTVAAQTGVATAAVPTGKAISPASATDSGPLGQIQSLLEGIGLLIRRTFFNQAPTVAPVQTSGQVTGPITGTIGAVDPEGDPLSYAVASAPQKGSLSIASDGTYSYTPGAGFTGLDGFTVSVTDGGFHINLLDLFRPASTDAYTQVAQNPNGSALTFAFIYGSGSQFWSTEARNALQSAAYSLASYVVAASPVTITYDVTAFSSAGDGTLASSGSDLTGSGGGFFATVVQQKIQTGNDANGTGADGYIDWNFGQPWGYAAVSNSQYDFTSTAMHELMHSFGVLSYIDSAGNNTYTDWTTFDRFITTSNGTPVVNPANFTWRSTYNSNLTGGGGGLYFSGSNAMAANGGARVPLYTPNPWESGSSVSHLANPAYLMFAQVDTGLAVRQLSPVEIGILKDLGYTINSQLVFVIVGVGLLRRRRNAR